MLGGGVMRGAWVVWMLGLAPGCEDAALVQVPGDAAADLGARDAAAPAADAEEVPEGGADPDAGPETSTRDAGDDAAARDAARPDAGPPPPVRLPAPVLRAPRNGWASGSALAVAGAAATDPLRPRLRWEAVTGATRYRVQLSTACEVGGFAECDFAGVPAVEVAAPSTELVPAERLAVSTTRPVGRRYYWRVQACDDVDCSAPSDVRYFDAGRLRDDFDGDGYSDVVVGAPDQDTDAVPGSGAAWIFAGSPDGTVPVPARALVSPSPDASGAFGRDIAAIGDVQGDGFADLAVGEPVYSVDIDAASVQVGRVHVYYGSASGIAALPDMTIDLPAAPMQSWFGSGLTGGEDIDGDGFSDVVVGAELRGAGHVYVFRGSAGGVEPTLAAGPSTPAGVANFGVGLSMLGDVNGDGFGDVGIGAFQAPAPVIHEGWAGVFLGQSGGLGSRASGTIVPEPEDSWIELGYRIAPPFDADADGFADVAVSAPYMDVVTVNEGTVLLFRGGRAGIAAAPDARLAGRDHDGDGYFGASLETGDFDGDGYDDLAAGVPLSSHSAYRGGRVWVFHGGPDLSALGAPTPIDPPSPGDQAQFATLASGDVDGDGFVDVVVAAPYEDAPDAARIGSAYVYLGSPDGFPSAPIVVRCPVREAESHFGVGLD